jgi:(5-formylfuran-3-yl)methyl phosphate synthase
MAIPDLLVSVRNLAEARAAVDAGCDRLDVKEPHHGPLGMADHAVISEIAAFALQTPVGDCVPCSVALGEMAEFTQKSSPFVLPRGVTDIKLGPAATRTADNWANGWRLAMERIGAVQLKAVQFEAEQLEAVQLETTRRVAVAYADWQEASAPPPEEILAAAIQLGADAFLIDTWQKRSGGLRDILCRHELMRLAATSHEAGLTFALAGSLRLGDIAALVEFGPDVIAVRGAACHGENRSADVSSESVRLLKAEICARFGPASKAPLYARP